jgi:UDPglucose--hexose-1-phosphate uridylyltransferase
MEESLIEETSSSTALNKQPNLNTIQELAEILSKTLQVLHRSLGDPGYSMLVQNAPYAQEGYEHLYKHYHWRIIIETHKLTTPAGYEHLTGIWSNSVPPEEAAKVLRNHFKEAS